MLRVKQPIRFELTGPLDEVQTPPHLSGIEVALELFRDQAVLGLERTQALSGPLQTQFQHPQLSTQSPFDRRLERNLGIGGDGDLLSHKAALHSL
ncbi:MAG: hypothetical protein AB1671_09015 [Thermodesulfobacteriota bacterium]